MSENRIRSREWASLPFYDPGGVLRGNTSHPDIGFIPNGNRRDWKPLRGNVLNQKRQ